MAARNQSTLEETARRGDQVGDRIGERIYERIGERDIKPTLAEDQHGRCVG